MNNSKKFILVMLILILYGVYLMKFEKASPPSIEMLKNVKYTVGEITSGYYYSKGGAYGYDYKFEYEKGIVRGAHQNGNFISGRKYLVAYDSTDIRNGYVILDKYDITDSLSKYRIYPTYTMYHETWPLQKIPFQYDKSRIEDEIMLWINR